MIVSIPLRSSGAQRRPGLRHRVFDKSDFLGSDAIELEITGLPPLQRNARSLRGVHAIFPETDHVGNGHRSQYSDDSISVIIEMSGRFQGYEPMNQAPQLGRYQFAVLLIDSTGGRKILACTRQHLVCIRERLR